MMVKYSVLAGALALAPCVSSAATIGPGCAPGAPANLRLVVSF